MAACIRDPQTGVGGSEPTSCCRKATASRRRRPPCATGAFAMEVLINEVLKAGAARERLPAKVFGSGAVLEAMQQMNIGERNGHSC